MAEPNQTVVLPRSLATKAKASTPGSGADRGASISRQRENLVFETVRTLRDTGQITAAVRALARRDGTVSAAVYALVQVANSQYKLRAYASGTHQFDPAATDLARSVAASMDTLYDYTEGFSDKSPLVGIIETGLREVVETGAVCGELVLDKYRLPQRINVIPYEQITWKAKGDGTKYPSQTSTSGDIDLNIATFWIAESHKEANVAYSTSMLEGALNTAFYYAEFIEDMRRAVRRSGHARVLVTLNAEKVRASAPPEIATDPAKLRAFMEDTRQGVVDVINAMEPEDALVTYDLAEMNTISADGEKMDYKELLAALSGMLATSLKTHPSILGLRLAGSQSLSNTESLIYLKIAKAIQRPIEQLMSRAMTLAVRLYGSDSYVKFEFNEIDLRPDSELEAFKIMKQQRVLEQLSLGFITDEEAAEELGTGPRAPGAPPLSGTFFHDTSIQDASSETINLKDGGMEKTLQGTAPKNGGGDSQ
jgi:hypothetical protein